ncbi:succinate dehydrogenase assembly factor 2, mitochondrial-like [Ischnura elegans]|uniref:succinate dehydrogenase assembly factor 2, mitochondrial-like n=1 Tax=Ischnura elegans TaxID=197161 RepID=UPI001ED8726A|nr:succinate dehydrogenase assembly factor 2, mitochondrial-like [Ischnura elegans]
MFLSRALRMVAKKDLSVISRSICSTPRMCSNYNDMHTPTDIVEPQIPPYVEKLDEAVDVKRARLLYQSRKRGMLENGLILSTFAAKHLAKMSADMLAEYDRMINLPSNDWDLYYWATGVRPVPAEFDNQVMKLLQDHIKNTNRELRIRQPDLY